MTLEADGLDYLEEQKQRTAALAVDTAIRERMAALAKMLGVAGKVCRGETCGGTIFFLPTTRGAPGDEGEGAVPPRVSRSRGSK